MNKSWDTAFTKIFKEALDRLHRRERKDLTKTIRQEKSILDWSEYYYEKNRQNIQDTLLPVVAAFMDRGGAMGSHNVKAIVEEYTEQYISRARTYLQKEGDFPRARARVESESLLNFVHTQEGKCLNLANGVDKHVN